MVRRQPANLDPLPPAQSAVRYVAMMGGSGKVLAGAREAYDRGEYRWAAQLLNHLVFAETDNAEARELLASAYEQLGYQAESGPWRNVYLSAARELRHGKEKGGGIDLAKAFEMLKRTPVARFFDSMAVRLNGPEADGKRMTVNVRFTDIGETHVLILENAVLHHHEGKEDPTADVTIAVTHDLFLRMLTGLAGIRETIFSDELEVSGSKIDLVRFLLLFERPKGDFNIVTP
jgi:alkyl sulfatase BDS1-like metallo-beta-lactamase superfamily hydrolase